MMMAAFVFGVNREGVVNAHNVKYMNKPHVPTILRRIFAVSSVVFLASTIRERYVSSSELM